MTIRFERDGTVGSIVLANPPYNRLDLRFADALRIAVHQAGESDIRVLVVRSEGPHFSFGGEVREWPGKDVNWFRTFVAEVNSSYRAIEMLKIPTVAVVRGVAFGGGFELALACDFLVAATTTGAIRNDARLLKTLLLSALVPEEESLRALTPARLAALNHGSVRSPIPTGTGESGWMVRTYSAYCPRIADCMSWAPIMW
jgi:enoyl-CoA hydratase/carnithine racemase